MFIFIFIFVACTYSCPVCVPGHKHEQATNINIKIKYSCYELVIRNITVVFYTRRSHKYKHKSKYKIFFL